MKVEIKCKHCKSQNFRREGTRKTDYRGKIQKYYCKDCHKFCTNDDGFYRMRNKPEIITMSIDMYISNLSSRKMRNQLKRHLNHKVSHVSVLDWVRRYTLKVHNFIENHSTTNEVPSERAGVSLPLGENRWLDLIRLSSRLDY